MTNKQRMEIVLRGGVPDVPPHWELVFQIEKEMFGMDAEAVGRAPYPSEAGKRDAMQKHYIEIQHRLIDECGWAACTGYSPRDVTALKREVGHKALVCTHDWDGVFWMPTGETMMEFATGLDGYQSIDPQGHMDIKAVREQYPQWPLMGNVNCAMLQETDERKIRESVRYCMEHGGVGKRYVFSTSNCIFKGLPPESYRVMLDEYRRICRAVESEKAINGVGRIGWRIEDSRPG